MSVEIDWNAVTGGADGLELAEAIRAFVHDKFQQVALPRFIRSVKVHGFEFGHEPPDVEIKDICDPLDDFYEDYSDLDDDEHGEPLDGNSSSAQELGNHAPVERRQYRNNATAISGSSLSMTDRRHDQAGAPGAWQIQHHHFPPHIDTRHGGILHAPAHGEHVRSSLNRSSTATPGIPGGTSNLSYFHLPLGAGLSGATTPLAAVAGAHFHGNGWQHDATTRVGLRTPDSNLTTTPASLSSMTPPSTADLSSRPSSQHHHDPSRLNDSVREQQDQLQMNYGDTSTAPQPQPSLHGKPQERSPQDLQVVAHVTYSGDVRMSLTAELLLDYPMESFVGIPLKLNITGLSFDGIAILAYIRRRAHFCFLSPEDAEIFIGSTQRDYEILRGSGNTKRRTGAGVEDDLQPRMPVGGLLEEIRVESEIGDRANGKQVLKNVGKVEKFVLEQVRRIFEDEFVYPSFWTFLI